MKAYTKEQKEQIRIRRMKMELCKTVYDGVEKYHFIASIQIKPGKGYEVRALSPFTAFAENKGEFLRLLTRHISDLFEPCEPRGRDSNYEYEFVRTTQPRCTEIGVYAYVGVLC